MTSIADTAVTAQRCLCTAPTTSQQGNSQFMLPVGLGEMINPGCFWVSYRDKPDFFKACQDMEAKLTHFMESLKDPKPGDLEPDTIVVVRMSHENPVRWIRGKIVSLWVHNDDGICGDIFLLDEGVVLRDVIFKNTPIKAMPEKFLHFKSPVVKFSLNNISPKRSGSKKNDDGLNTSPLTPVPKSKAKHWSNDSVCFTKYLLTRSVGAFIVVTQPDSRPHSGVLHLELKPDISDEWFLKKKSDHLLADYVDSQGRQLINLNRCLIKNNFANYKRIKLTPMKVGIGEKRKKSNQSSSASKEPMYSFKEESEEPN